MQNKRWHEVFFYTHIFLCERHMNLSLNALFSCSQSKSVKVKTAFGLSIDFFRLLLIGVRLHSCFLVSNVFLRSNETSETRETFTSFTTEFQT